MTCRAPDSNRDGNGCGDVLNIWIERRTTRDARHGFKFCAQRNSRRGRWNGTGKIFFHGDLARGVGARMAALSAREEFGGSGLSRLNAASGVRGPGDGLPDIAAYLSVHNMCAWMLDALGSPGATPCLRGLVLPRWRSCRVIVSHETLLRLRRERVANKRRSARRSVSS